VYSTRASRHLAARPDQVFRALTDGDLIGRWRVPDGMTSQVHEFDGREGGEFRVSLTYDRPTDAGKSSPHTDTYHGRFLRLAEDRLVVESVEFETPDPVLRGEMTMTTTITPSGSGCLVEMLHEQVPDAVPPADNQAGMETALRRLAALLEADDRPAPG
jgi:uncharacterized protein YndB with AHSA1/START domain